MNETTLPPQATCERCGGPATTWCFAWALCGTCLNEIIAAWQRTKRDADKAKAAAAAQSIT